MEASLKKVKSYKVRLSAFAVLNDLVFALWKLKNSFICMYTILLWHLYFMHKKGLFNNSLVQKWQDYFPASNIFCIQRNVAILLMWLQEVPSTMSFVFMLLFRTPFVENIWCKCHKRQRLLTFFCFSLVHVKYGRSQLSNDHDKPKNAKNKTQCETPFVCAHFLYKRYEA